MRYDRMIDGKRLRRWKFSLVLFLLLHGALGVARAESGATSPDSCTLDDACNRLVKQAVSDSQQKQYADALQLYQAAYAIRPEPRLLVSIGRMQHKLQRWEDARQSYQNFLATSTRPDDEPYRKKATEWLKELESQPLSAPGSQASTGAAPPGVLVTSDPRATESKPIYKKWWFWTAIGGTLVAATAVSVGVVLGTRSGRMIDQNAYVFTF
jgi:tetratricopeptide (TPR) repeat protein